MRPCKICGQYRDTIHGICGSCKGKQERGKIRKSQSKRAGIIIGVVIVASVIGIYAYQNFLASPLAIEMMDKAMEGIDKASERIQDELPKISETIENIQVPDAPPLIAEIPEFFESKPTSIDESKAAIDYINELRVDVGRNKISFDARVYDLAIARVRDTIEYDYFDHTNPITGTCPDSMKKDYGLRSNEYVAENLGSGYSSEKAAINGWMGSQGHRYNLLYSDHTAGAVACEKSVCAFLGLNNDLFGSGCSTAAQGQAWHKELGKCSDEQFAQLDRMNEKYLRDVAEYEKLPQIAQSEAEYQKGMQMYNDLQKQLAAIENFKCN